MTGLYGIVEVVDGIPWDKVVYATLVLGAIVCGLLIRDWQRRKTRE